MGFNPLSVHGDCTPGQGTLHTCGLKLLPRANGEI